MNNEKVNDTPVDRQFEQRLMALGPQTLRYLRHYVDGHTAEDLLQEGFARALEARHSFDTERASLSTWFGTIVHHLLIDHERRERLRHERETVFFRSQQAPRTRDRSLPENITYTSLKSGFARMNNQQRLLFALMLADDVSMEEATIVLGVVPATVRSILSRGRHFLHEALSCSDGIENPAV